MEKYAVIETETIHHAGDERSRTNPGHGYPAHTTESQVFRTFESLEKLKSWILMQSQFKSFKAIKYAELTITRNIEVNVS